MILERLSKAATIASVLVIVLLQLFAHPDVTPLLQILAAVGFVAGWASGRLPRAMALWTVLLVLSPGVLRLVAGREGPVLDLVPLAALGGALVRAVPWSRWQLPPLWSLLIGGWTLTLSLAWPVIVAREAGFEAAGIVNTSAITSWAVLSAAQTIGWIGSVVLVQLVALLWFDWVFAKTASEGRPPAALHGLWIGITVASLVAIVQGFVDGGFLTTAAWARDERATGTMLDANAFGAAAALAAVAGFVAVRARLLTGGRPVAAVVLGVNLLGAWLSASRTMLLIDVVGLAGMFGGLTLQRQDRGDGFRRAAGATAAALVIVLLMTASAGPLRRLFDMPGGGRVPSDVPSARAFAKELLWIRGGYGPVAHQMLREYPVTGIGVGSFHFMAADYYREISRDDGLPFDNAQNWWRQMLVELGLLGGAAPILWSLLVAWSVLKPARATAEPAAARQAAHVPAVDYALKGLLVGVALCSIVGVPTQSVVVQLAFLGVLAWLIAPATRVAGGDGGSPLLRAGWVIVTVIALAYATGHVLLARGSLNPTARAERFQREYVGGGHALERDEEGTPYNWTDDDSTFVLPRTHPWLVLRMWADHPDIASQPVHVTLSAQCGAFFETTFSGRERITVGIEVPDSYHAVDLRVTVSRTWSPSDHGGRDRRRLGVAVVHGFTDEANGRVADRLVTLPVCAAGQ